MIRSHGNGPAALEIRFSCSREINFMSTTLKDIGIGLTAGTIGGEALKRSAQSMWEYTSLANKSREQAIEPRDPFIVLAQRLGRFFFDKKPTKTQQEMFETAVVTTVTAGAGVAYVMLARRWPLGWLAGGAIFGAAFFLVEDEGMGTAMGLFGDVRKYPPEAHVRGLVAHVAFGIAAAGVARFLGVTSDKRTVAHRRRTAWA